MTFEAKMVHHVQGDEDVTDVVLINTIATGKMKVLISNLTIIHNVNHAQKIFLHWGIEINDQPVSHEASAKKRRIAMIATVNEHQLHSIEVQIYPNEMGV